MNTEDLERMKVVQNERLTADPRAPNSNYKPFDVPIGKASDFPDDKEGNKKIHEKLKDIKRQYNPAGKGYGIGDM